MLSDIIRKFRLFGGRRNYADINPDEILVDSQNLPQFDKTRLEGRIEKPISLATFVTFAIVCGLILIIFSYKAYSLQVLDGDRYASISANNSLHHELIIAPRGVIYDRNGKTLVYNKISTSTDSEDYPVRIYPQESGFSHILGYVKYPQKDSSGFYFREEYEPQTGIELNYNNILGGSNGLKIRETDVSGNVVSESNINQAREGRKVLLSIDARVQERLYRAIHDTAEQSHFIGGAGVIIDVNSGELLAIASYPEYDSQVMTDGEATSTISSYSQDERRPFLDRAVSGVYTPGSIVKPFLAFAALEEGVITPEKEIVSTGQLVVPNPYFPDQPSIFKDWKAHGATDMREAIAVSSDTYFYQIGGGFGSQQGLGISRIDEYLRKFGFGEETNIDLGDEALGVIPDPVWKAEIFDGEPWRLGDTYNTSIGQYGNQVTVIQAARATAALANGGVLVTPTILKQATSSVPNGESIGGDSEHYKIAKEGMHLAVEEGTAIGLNMKEVEIGGKTGTAEVGANKEFVNSWIIGFFPYDKPRYAFAVVMERAPAGTPLGAMYAMRQTMDWLVGEAPEYIE